jgi:drug/metabolite transporter (DMT)-like permease
LAALILLPFFIRACRKHGKNIKKNLWKILLISIPLAFGGIAHHIAISESSATFVAVLGSLGPIAFAVASTMVTKDKISRNAIAGLLVAILGGVIVVILPPVLGHAELFFGIVPVLLVAFYIFTDVLWQITRRKQDEARVPMSAILAIPFFVATVVSCIMAWTFEGPSAMAAVTTLPLTDWLMIIYLAVIISVVAHAWSTKVYEKLGTATTASLDYVYYIAAPVVPMLLIGESLTWEICIGAVLIIIGIILTRKHHEKRKMHRAHI